MRQIAQLAARHRISTRGATQLGLLLGLLSDDPAAPTGIREQSRGLDDHLADSLAALELEQVRAAARIADLGAGAGVPGLPLAIALPGAEVTLIESSHRKCEFISRAIVACGLTNAAVVCARAEGWPGGLGCCDLVTARALAPLAVVAEYAAPLLRVGGALVIWRGQRDRVDEATGARAAAQVGLETLEIRHVQPYPGAINRHLHVMAKLQPTPARFPRRPGVARKRPLGQAEGGGV